MTRARCTASRSSPSLTGPRRAARARLRCFARPAGARAATEPHRGRGQALPTQLAGVGDHLPLEVVVSPYRSTVAPLANYIAALHRQRPDVTLTLVVPRSSSLALAGGSCTTASPRALRASLSPTRESSLPRSIPPAPVTQDATPSDLPTRRASGRHFEASTGSALAHEPELPPRVYLGVSANKVCFERELNRPPQARLREALSESG